MHVHCTIVPPRSSRAVAADSQQSLARPLIAASLAAPSPEADPPEGGAMREHFTLHSLRPTPSHDVSMAVAGVGPKAEGFPEGFASRTGVVRYRPSGRTRAVRAALRRACRRGRG